MIKSLQYIKTSDMKKTAKLFALLLVMTVLVPSKSFAQDGKKNVFKTNLLSPLLGSYNFFYERVLSPKTSIQLGGGFTNIDISGTKLSGFRITPEFRFYPTGTSPKGFYLAPFANYQNLSLTVTDALTNFEGKATLTTIGGGLDIGYQWIFGDVVTLDLYIGPSFNSGEIEVETNGFSEDRFSVGGNSGTGVRFGLSLGVAF